MFHKVVIICKSWYWKDSRIIIHKEFYSQDICDDSFSVLTTWFCYIQEFCFEIFMEYLFQNFLRLYPLNLLSEWLMDDDPGIFPIPWLTNDSHLKGFHRSNRSIYGPLAKNNVYQCKQDNNYTVYTINCKDSQLPDIWSSSSHNRYNMYQTIFQPN